MGMYVQTNTHIPRAKHTQDLGADIHVREVNLVVLVLFLVLIAVG